jgi:LemA protein
VKIRRFPANIFAGIFGFDTKQMFAADQGAQNAPKVSFD